MNDADFLRNVTGGVVCIGIPNLRESIAYCEFSGSTVVIGLKVTAEGTRSDLLAELSALKAALQKLDKIVTNLGPKP